MKRVSVAMDARRRPRMRRLVDHTVALVQSGELSAELAAQKLLENGVPVAVIGRVLGMALEGKRSAVEIPPAEKSVPVKKLAAHPA